MALDHLASVANLSLQVKQLLRANPLVRLIRLQEIPDVLVNDLDHLAFDFVPVAHNFFDRI